MQHTTHGIVIAGTKSGSGKTTITLGLMAALKRRGFRVAPFKVGPDFIDPGHHSLITGTVSRNLDGWMLSKSYNLECFQKYIQDSDIAVVEGVMGLFDGYDGKSEAGSTAQMAKWLGLPVILIVDAKSMARSAAALVQGFERFDSQLTFAGVLFNNLGSERHLAYLKEAIEDNVDMPCLGGIIHNKDIAIPERHLGLVTRHDHPLSDTAIDKLADLIENSIDITSLFGESAAGNQPAHQIINLPPPFAKGAGGILHSSPPFAKGAGGILHSSPPFAKGAGGILHLKKDRCGNPPRPPFAKGGRNLQCGVPATNNPQPTTHNPQPTIHNQIRIGVAKDNAFCFYYQDNLDLLEAFGAELVEFSPIAENTLPPNIDGLYFGGGYPELFAAQLADNANLRREIREKSKGGMPIYGECGGFMYLCNEIRDKEGKTYPMTGCFPFTTAMFPRLKSLGYREITLTEDTILGKRGQSARGHEFHYSELSGNSRDNDIEAVYHITDRTGQKKIPEGYQRYRTLGSYIHLHFGSRPEIAQAFVDSCRVGFYPTIYL